MAHITLKSPWTYRTPLVTIAYPEGGHRVTKEIAAAALNDGVIEEEADDRTSKPAEAGTSGDPDNGEG